MNKEQDVPKALAETFKRLGGIAEFAKWARTHKTIFYSHYVKMIPLSVTASVDTNVNVNIVGEQARQKLISAFNALIDARRDDDGRAAVDVTTYTRLADQSARAADPSTQDAPADETPASTVDGSEDQNKNSNHLQHERVPFDGGPRSRTSASAQYPRPVSDENTTDLYYRWLEGPGGARQRWGPI